MDSLIIFGAKYLFLSLPLIFLFMLYQASTKDRKKLIIAIVVAVIIAAILDKIGTKLYYDPRPFVTHHVKPLVSHAADNGFPSEHTLFCFAFATVTWLYRRRLGWLALALALIVGICRVAAHVHSPIDIIGGLLMGVAAGYLGKWLTERYFKPSR